MTWQGRACDTFFMQSGLSEHLFVVLTDPNTYLDEGYGQRFCLVSVNFTSVRDGRNIDNACIITAGEHPFIQHDSYVLYEKMEFMDYERTFQAVNDGVYRASTPVSSELLQRIINGIQQSGSVKRKFKILFRR